MLRLDAEWVISHAEMVASAAMRAAQGFELHCVGADLLMFTKDGKQVSKEGEVLA